MKKKHIVVAGRAYADIDVLACISSYTQLLTLKNRQAQGIITGPWNQTIPSTVRKWHHEIENQLLFPKEACRFILVDISDPKFVDDFVVLEHVTEVYDHHYGHETYWKAKLPHSTHIERVGACATLIWEKFKEYGCQPAISKANANLLYTAIFANTLNFKSVETSQRDILASEELLKHISLPKDWKNIYYSEVAEGFNQHLSELIQKDTKRVDYRGSPIFFGQIEIWNGASIVDKFENKFHPNPKEEWLINIASIEENHSYFYSNSARLREQLKLIADANEINPYLQRSNRLWLRKEILRELSAHIGDKE